MRNNTIPVLLMAALGVVAGLPSCDLPAPDAGGPDGADEAGFLGISIAEFGDARAIPVHPGVVTSQSTEVTLPEDLFDTAPPEGSVAVPDPSVTVAGDTGIGPADVEGGEGRLFLVLRLAAAGEDACTSDVQIGPFEATLANGIARLVSEILPLPADALAILRQGRFSICAQLWGDFDGEVLIGEIELRFGSLLGNQEPVEVCHIPRRNPDNRRTITVGGAALRAHLAHGDYLGPCRDYVAPLALSAVCSDDPVVERRWRIDNPNDFDLAVTWQQMGSNLTGSLTATPGESYFTTVTVGNISVVTITWPDEIGVLQSDQQESPGERCAADADGDGVSDGEDACPDTPAGEEVDATGCSCSQRDGDGDGVDDCTDLCPATPAGETVDATGCTAGQADADGDGVPDEGDACPDTAAGEEVDATGCSCSQRDGDGDGVDDCTDLCPATPLGEEVDATGCAPGQGDADGDGVPDGADACPDTPAGEEVDTAGCSCSQRDGDGDGVDDCADLCPDTPAGEAVGADGCAMADADEDGVPDGQDACPDTPPDEAADAEGCSCSQRDGDGDGVTDCDDLCPGTPPGAVVDGFGCPRMLAEAGPDLTLEEAGVVTLQGSASGGMPPYSYAWSAPGWEGAAQQNPTVLVAETTTYTLTVTDWSFPPQTATDTVTVTVEAHSVLQYEIVGLGSLSSNASYPAGINDLGQVVGYYYTDSWAKRAFLYSEGGMVDLGTLGGDQAYAHDINDAGQVVGEAQDGSGAWHAFLWDSTEGMQDLGTLGGASSVAYAVNAEGRVVGYSDTGSANHAFLYCDGAMSDLGTFDYAQSGAFDINDQSQVVGLLLPHTGGASAFIHDGGTLQDLGTLLLEGSQAWVINNSGLVAGHAWQGGEYHSFLYAPGAVVDLGTLGGFANTYIWGVSDTGQLVGSVTNQTGTLSHACLYAGGELYDLNDLLVPDHGWDYLTTAEAVNNSGRIVGYGRVGGQYEGFLLIPVP